jgi:hypothetical protein
MGSKSAHPPILSVDDENPRRIACRWEHGGNGDNPSLLVFRAVLKTSSANGSANHEIVVACRVQTGATHVYETSASQTVQRVVREPLWFARCPPDFAGVLPEQLAHFSGLQVQAPPNKGAAPSATRLLPCLVMDDEGKPRIVHLNSWYMCIDANAVRCLECGNIYPSGMAYVSHLVPKDLVVAFQANLERLLPLA